MRPRTSIVVCTALIAAAPLWALPATSSAKAAITCHGIKATIVGSDNADHIKGTKRRDVISGQGGDDVINGLGGNDIICGDNGSDVLYGGKGADALYGGLDRRGLVGTGASKHWSQIGDTLDGGPGNDTINPEQDRRRDNTPTEITVPDTISWATSRTAVRVNVSRGIATGAGTDRFPRRGKVKGLGFGFVGSKHDDRMVGSNKHDLIWPGPGNDVVKAKDGRDEVDDDVTLPTATTPDDDKIDLGPGNDVANLKSGSDIVHGSTGNDTITDVGKRGIDQYYGDEGFDTITDWLVGRKGQVLSGGDGNADKLIVAGDFELDATNSFAATIRMSGSANSSFAAYAKFTVTIDGEQMWWTAKLDPKVLSPLGVFSVVGTDDDNWWEGGYQVDFNAKGGNDTGRGGDSILDNFDAGGGAYTDTSLGGFEYCTDVEQKPTGDCHP
jgi:Ca2+-binding RTX toxin-like protein